MLLRVRVSLPDRPGALGQVARTMGVSGADIVQVVVLERLAGRAVDDFTVVWPGAARVQRLLAGLAAVPGVRVDGVWRAVAAPLGGGHDAGLLSQVAANPDDGLATLVDAVPGLVAADWAAALSVPVDWAERVDAPAYPGRSSSVARTPNGYATVGRGDAEPHAPLSGGRVAGEPAVAYTSWRAPDVMLIPELTPLRARPLRGPDGTWYAVAPFGRAGLVLVVARVDGDELPAAAFHVTEVERVAQVVRAAAVILGERLDRVVAPAAVRGGPVRGTTR